MLNNFQHHILSLIIHDILNWNEVACGQLVGDLWIELDHASNIIPNI